MNQSDTNIIMSQKTENLYIHSYIAEVTVERVNIQIKFPCSVAASLKIGRQQCFSREVKLTSGLAEIGQRIQVATQLTFDAITKQYSQKKTNRRFSEAAIYVHIISQTGRNTAGVCYLDLVDIVNKPPYDLVKRPLERCPDHNAQLSYRVRLKFEEQLPFGTQSSASDTAKEKPEQGNQKPEQVLLREASQFSLMGGNFKSKVQQISRPSPEFSKEVYREPPATARISQQPPTDLSWMPRGRPSSYSRVQWKSPADTLNAPLPSPHYNSNSRVLSKPNAETLLQVQRRAAKLQAQRDSQLKEMANLNNQLETLRSQLFNKSTKELELATELERAKRKAQSQQLQIQSLKKTHEKAGRISEKAGEELQQKLNRISDYEQEIRILRAQRQTAQKTCKEKAREAQQLTERLEDLNNSQATLQKRLDMKDSFYKQEIKKYSEKLVDSQLQKQKLLSQVENLKGSSDEKDRRIKVLLIERDKLVQQEKNKLTKKYDLLRNEYQKLATERLNERQEMLNSSSMLERLKNSNSEYNLQKIRLEEEIQRLKNKLYSQTLQKNKLEEELKEKALATKSVIIRQIESDRKDKNELLQIIQKQLQEKTQQNRQIADRLSQLQKKLKEKEIRVADQNFEIDSLKKRNQATRKSMDKKYQEWAAQQTALRDQITLAQQMKSEYQSTVRKYEQQIEEQNNRSSRLLAQIGEKSQLLSELQDSSLRASTNSVRLQDRIRKLTEDNQILETQIKRLKNSETQRNQKILKVQQERDNIKLSHELNERLTKQKENAIIQLQNEIDNLKQKLSETECMLQDQKSAGSQLASNFQTLIVQKNSITIKYDQLLQKNTSAQSQLDNLKKQLNFSQQQVSESTKLWKKLEADNSSLASELQNQKSFSKALKQENMNLREEFYLVGQEAKQISKQLEESQKQILKIKKQKTTLENSIQCNSSELEMYKKRTRQGIKYYSELVIKEESLTAAQLDQLVQSCEIELSEILVDLLRKQGERKSNMEDRSKRSEDLARQLREQLSFAKQQLTLFAEQINNLTIELDLKDEQKQLVEASMKLKQQDLQTQIQNMAEDQTNLEENFVNMQQKLKTSEDNMLKFQAERIQLERQLNQYSKEAEQVKADLEHANKKIEYLQSQVDSVNLQRTSETHTINQFKNKTLAEQNQLQKQLSEKTAELQGKIIQLQQYEENKFDNDKLKIEIDQLKAALTESAEKLSNNSVQIQDLQQKLKSNLKKQKQIQEKINGINQKTVEQEELISQFEITQMKLQSKVRDAQQLLKASEKQRETLSKQLQQTEAELLNSEFSLNNMRREIQTDKLDFEAYESRIKNKDNELKLYLEELIHRQKQLDDLSEEHNKLKAINSRLSRDLVEKNAHFNEISQLNSSELKGLTQKLEELNMEYNVLKQHLEEEENTVQGLKKAYQKEKEEWKYKEGKLESEIMELNEQLYSISSDVNTMRLKEEEDQENAEKLQQQNDQLLNLYMAQKKKNQILNQNSHYIQADDKKIQELGKQIQDLRTDVIKRTEQVQRLTAQNEKLQQQIIDNPLIKELQEKTEQITRSLQEQLMISQEMLNRERSDFESLRREYHQKCIGYQQKIRTLQIQFRANRDHEERLDTIEQEKSSNPPSQIGKSPSQNPLSSFPDQGEIQRLSRQLQHKNGDILIYEEQIRQMEQAIIKLQTSASIHSGDLEAMQGEIKKLVSMKIRQTDAIHEMNNIVNRIKAKSLAYSRLPAQNKDLMSEFKLLQVKINEIMEYNKEVPQIEEITWHEDRSPTQSTDIMESSSLNDLGRGQQLSTPDKPTSPKELIPQKMNKNR